MDDVTREEQANVELHGDSVNQAPAAAAPTEPELHGDTTAASPTAESNDVASESAFPLSD
jgi:hypothetical protein